MSTTAPAWSIRAATPDDLPRIGELAEAVNQLHHAAWPGLFAAQVAPERHRALWSASLPPPPASGHAGRTTIFVADGPAGVLGFVSVSVIDERSPFFRPMRLARVGTLGVEAGWRGQGIGRALMRAAEAWARDQGAEDLQLNVWAFNQRAQAFYAALGYGVRAQTLGKPLLPAAEGAGEDPPWAG